MIFVWTTAAAAATTAAATAAAATTATTATATTARFANHKKSTQQSLLRGRHPRSFTPSGDLWRFVDDSTERLGHVAKGRRRLWQVNEEIRAERVEKAVAALRVNRPRGSTAAGTGPSGA